MGGGVYRLPKSLRLSLSDFCGFPYKPEQGEGKLERAANRESSGANPGVPAELPEAHPAGAVSLGARAGAQLPVLAVTFRVHVAVKAFQTHWCGQAGSLWGM